MPTRSYRIDNACMTDENQTVVPPAFIALFVPSGRVKPTLPREEIAARHEFCDDLAAVLTEHARTQQWQLGVTEGDVLERMHIALCNGEAGVSAAEAGWVVGRLAEMLDWPVWQPAAPPAA